MRSECEMNGNGIRTQRLGEICQEGKPDIDEYLNCRYINERIKRHLHDVGVDVELIVGGIWQTQSHREEHAYLLIPADQITDAHSDVIVDGSIKQFCESNRDDLWVVLGPKEDLPEVAVLTGDESNDWYSYFLPDQP